MATTGTREFKNYIGGEWVDAASGETFEIGQPGRRRAARRLPEVGRRRTSTAPSPRRRRRSRTGGSCPAPKRGEILFRFAQLVTEHKAELTDLMTHEMGKVKAEAGGDVQEAIDMTLLHGRRGPPPVGPDDAVRAARQVQHERAHADRRRRRDHAVELPDRDPVVEDRAGARLRQHGRLQAGDGHAAARPAIRRAARRGRRAGGRRQRRARRRARRRRPARPPPGRPGDHAHRLARDRGGGDAERGRLPQARPPRARRQERDHRPRRRGSRPRRRRDHLVGVRHVRPALHGRVARDRAGRRLRRARVAARVGGRAVCGSAPAGKTTPTSAR